jgi:predicted nuclease of predicted toxin-antitoxin system
VKFIVDAQLPKSLSDFLNKNGYDSMHTLDLPYKNKTKDYQIAKKANEEQRVVISKDIDFLESFIVKSEPQKLIMVKTGNISNKQLIDLFDGYLDILVQMISRSDLVEINQTEIAEHG